MNIRETVSHYARSFDQVESIVQALPFAVVLTDQKGIVHYHNEIFERVVKKKHEKIDQHTIDQLIDKKIIKTIEVGTHVDIIVENRSFVIRKEHAYVHGVTYHLYLLASLKHLEQMLHVNREKNELLETVMQENVQPLTNEAETLLYNYPWPGNIRELGNVLERAMDLLDRHEKVDDRKQLPEKRMTVPNSKPIIPLVELMEKTEREALQSALLQTNGNRSKAAKQLGISRTSFYEKLAKYELN